MQSRMSRLVRGWIAGSFATGVAALCHGVVDGGAPSPLALLLALVFAGLLGTFAIGRRPSLPRLTVVVAGAQLAFHLVFSFFTPGTATGTGHHGATALESAAAHHGSDPWMWAAHAIALLATLAFLRRAELALWQLLRDAFRLVALRLPAIAALPAVWRLVRGSQAWHPALRAFLSVQLRRGPPALAGA